MIKVRMGMMELLIGFALERVWTCANFFMETYQDNKEISLVYDFISVIKFMASASLLMNRKPFMCTCRGERRAWVRGAWVRVAWVRVLERANQARCSFVFHIK